MLAVLGLRHNSFCRETNAWCVFSTCYGLELPIYHVQAAVDQQKLELEAAEKQNAAVAAAKEAHEGAEAAMKRAQDDCRAMQSAAQEAQRLLGDPPAQVRLKPRRRGSWASGLHSCAAAAILARLVLVHGTRRYAGLKHCDPGQPTVKPGLIGLHALSKSSQSLFSPQCVH